MLRSLVVASAWWVSTQAVVVDEDAGAKKEVLLQGEAKVVEVSEHLLKNYLQNDGTAVPSFSEEDRSEEEASAFTGYSWTSKGVEMGKEADFFQRSANPVAGAAVLASEFEKFGQAGVASPTVLAENGYIQTESATALTMEEAEEQANFFVWTQKGIDKGLKAAFFEEGSVPSAGQTVTGRDFKHFTEILAPDNELLKKLQGAPISFVSRRGKGRKGKGRKGKGRKGKGRKGKGRQSVSFVGVAGEAEDQANLDANMYVWTPKGIQKGQEHDFFQQDSVPSAGQVVSSAELQHFTDDDVINQYIALNTPDAAQSFVSLSGKGRKGKGRKGKGRKGKGRKGKGRKGKGRSVAPMMLDEEDSAVDEESSESDSDIDYESVVEDEVTALESTDTENGEAEGGSESSDEGEEHTDEYGEQ